MAPLGMKIPNIPNYAINKCKKSILNKHSYIKMLPIINTINKKFQIDIIMNEKYHFIYAQALRLQDHAKVK